uniref:Uncharacterized protein n=1 Tax=Arundo donax TaxID=35708 RepID=A0A0A9UA52_ARUDO
MMRHSQLMYLADSY